MVDGFRLRMVDILIGELKLKVSLEAEVGFEFKKLGFGRTEFLGRWELKSFIERFVLEVMRFVGNWLYLELLLV